MQIKMPFCERDLVRARQILNSWTTRKRLSSDEADIIVRMIAQGIAGGRREGLEMAAAERPNANKNHLDEVKDDLGVKS
jgi:hypothetical protein